MVILPASEFDSIMEELEEFDDVRIYDEAKRTIQGNVFCFLIM